MNQIRLQARPLEDWIEIRALIEHPMESGQRYDENNQRVPAHFIREITILCNGQEILKSDWGPGVAKNPFFSMRYRGNPGDVIELVWHDNLGYSERALTQVPR